MGKQKAILIALFIMLYVLFASAATLPFQSNADATIEVTPNDGGGKQTFEVEGGVEKSLSITWTDEGWQNTESDCEFKIISKNALYLDTTFTHNVSTNWNGKLEVELPLKPLPTDTAFIPIRTNVDLTLTAKPIKMIKGGNPTDDFSFSFKAKVLDTLKLPVETDLIDAIISTNNLVQTVGYGINNGKISLSLPLDYLNGNVSLHAVTGKIIGQMDLSSQTKNSLSIWDVATGMYILHIQGKNNISYTKKFQHNGGTIVLASDFNSSSVTPSQAVRSAAIARATAQYDFILDASEANYKDTTVTVDLTGQMNGMRTFYLIDPSDTNGIGSVLDEFTYEELFPFRYGFGRGYYADGNFPPDDEIQYHKGDGFFDFYNYKSLSYAIKEMSKIEVDIYQLVGHDYMHRIEWRHKETGEVRHMTNNAAYEEYKKTNDEYHVGLVDYANFCKEGSNEIRKLELAAFLANISHETTGQGTDEKTKRWGLYWREERDYQMGNSGRVYRDEGHTTYPPVGSHTYHGMGPIQLSWNYNYGQASDFLFGDKQVLLDNPDKVITTDSDNDGEEDAGLAFQTAIWFWMTPQAPKPSCHDVMVENWQPDADDIAKGRDKSRFGMTINIINGGLECNKGDNTSSPLDRIEFYKRYAQLMGVQTEDYCDCGSMGYW